MCLVNEQGPGYVGASRRQRREAIVASPPALPVVPARRRLQDLHCQRRPEIRRRDTLHQRRGRRAAPGQPRQVGGVSRPVGRDAWRAPHAICPLRPSKPERVAASCTRAHPHPLASRLTRAPAQSISKRIGKPTWWWSCRRRGGLGLPGKTGQIPCLGLQCSSTKERACRGRSRLQFSPCDADHVPILR